MSRSYASYVTLDMQIIYLFAIRLVRSIVHLRCHVRYLVGAQRFSWMKIIQRQTAASKSKKYYSLNLHTKYSSVNEKKNDKGC